MRTAPPRYKKTVSATLKAVLLQQARDAGINLSATLTEALRKELHTALAKKWQRENRAAILELNRISDAHGLLSDDYRTF